jgi:hypothetical protein
MPVKICEIGLAVAIGCSGWLGGQELPDAPKPQQDRAQRSSSTDQLPAILAPQISRERLSAGDKVRLYAHQAFNPLALVPPVFTAAITMANPPDRYPREWKDGGEAFGRLYGDGLARREAQQAATMLVGVMAGEDPRYLPSTSHATLGRVTHALVFVFIDKSDSGKNMPAVSTFAGAAANGFTGMAYLPRGYRDVTHAGQRSALALLGFGASNVANEFCPQWGPLVEKLHLPFVHPPCLERMGLKP